MATLTNFILEISKKVEDQEKVLNSKKEAIQKLERKLKEKEVQHKKQVTELEIERKQQQYISRVMEEQDQKKKTRDRLLAVPKTKRWPQQGGRRSQQLHVET